MPRAEHGAVGPLDPEHALDTVVGDGADRGLEVPFGQQQRAGTGAGDDLGLGLEVEVGLLAGVDQVLAVGLVDQLVGRVGEQGLDLGVPIAAVVVGQEQQVLGVLVELVEDLLGQLLQLVVGGFGQLVPQVALVEQVEDVERRSHAQRHLVVEQVGQLVGLAGLQLAVLEAQGAGHPVDPPQQLGVDLLVAQPIVEPDDQHREHGDDHGGQRRDERGDPEAQRAQVPGRRRAERRRRGHPATRRRVGDVDSGRSPSPGPYGWGSAGPTCAAARRRGRRRRSTSGRGPRPSSAR